MSKLYTIGILSFLTLLGACSVSSQRDEVVAEVNSRSIDIRDFEQALAKVSEFPIKDYKKNENRMDLLRDMVSEELLFQEALKSKIYERSYSVKKAIVRAYLKERYSSQLETVDAQEVKQFFEKNKDVLEKVKASHILIKGGEGAIRTESQALKTIEDIKAKYLKNPSVEYFEQLAKDYSEDPGSKKSGGTLGFFNRKTMVPEFTQVSFNMNKVGDISDPVKTQYGYHLIVLTGDNRGLERFEKNIRSYLLKEKNKIALSEQLSELKSAAKIKVFQEQIQKIASTETEKK